VVPVFFNDSSVTARGLGRKETEPSSQTLYISGAN
jgi:hypothetical protein